MIVFTFEKISHQAKFCEFKIFIKLKNFKFDFFGVASIDGNSPQNKKNKLVLGDKIFKVHIKEALLLYL